MRDKKSTQNRSSIIRIIISNYDDRGIKEVKVRYKKQAQLDTFLIESDVGNGEFLLNNIKWKAKDKNRYNIDILKDNNSFTVTKYDIFLEKVIRKYRITFDVLDKNNRVVTASIEDCLIEENEKIPGERDNIRRNKSYTERKLIDSGVQSNYARIACCSPAEIDAIKIYKIKRYLNYRSNMLIYFSMINDFFCDGINWEKYEMYKIKDDMIPDIVDYFSKKFNTEIEYHNNRIDNSIKKKSAVLDTLKDKKMKLENSDENKKELEKVVGKIESIESEITQLKSEKIVLSHEELTSDIINILDIYGDLRHKLAHYNYSYFEDLFENKNEDEEFAKRLDLKIFNFLPLIRKIKIENKTNYLDDTTRITIMNKSNLAKVYYSLYNILCEQKNGFNNFINSFFTTDGVEDKDFKKLIDEQLKKDIAFLKSRIKDRKKHQDSYECDLLEKQLETFGTAYYEDIHNCVGYKKIYNKRKNCVETYNKILHGNRGKRELTKIQKKLLELKNQMEEITKRNSIIRLKYKLQVAYGFIMKEFDGNISRFKNEFDSSKIEEIKEYKNRGLEYLQYQNNKFDSLKFQKSLEMVQDQHKDSWFSNDKSNNLFKFYVLTYLLLPVELRGDFLGFVKKHYYDIKNVEFLDENISDSTAENLEKLKNDSFFNKIRLFEKNSKRYNLFDNSILTSERLQEYFKLLNLKIPFYEFTDPNGEQRGIFNKNVLMPIFKYYQIVLKLYNDIEIAILLILSNMLNENNLSKIQEYITNKHTSKENKFYNFNNLLSWFEKVVNAGNVSLILSDETMENTKPIKKIVFLRNKICHLEYKEFMYKLLKTEEIKITKAEKGERPLLLVNETIRRLLEYVKNNKIEESIDLGYDFINDYYMKKEQLMHGQIKQTKNENIDSKRQRIRDNEVKLFAMYKLNIEKLDQIYNTHKYIRELLESPIFPLSLVSSKKIDFNLVKIKNKTVPQIIEEKKIDMLRSSLYKHSSMFLGVYKKEVIKKIKKAIVDKLIYEEEKWINFYYYDAINKKYGVSNLLAVRDKSSNNYALATLKDCVKNLNLCKKKKSLILDEDNTVQLDILKDNGSLLKIELPKYNDEENMNKNIDLSQHYSFNINFNYSGK